MKTTLTFTPSTYLAYTHYTSEVDGLVFDTHSVRYDFITPIDGWASRYLLRFFSALDIAPDMWEVTKEGDNLRATVNLPPSDIKRSIQQYWAQLQCPGTNYHFNVSDNNGGVDWEAVDDLLTTRGVNDHCAYTEHAHVWVSHSYLPYRPSNIDKLYALYTLATRDPLYSPSHPRQMQQLVY